MADITLNLNPNIEFEIFVEERTIFSNVAPGQLSFIDSQEIVIENNEKIKISVILFQKTTFAAFNKIELKINNKVIVLEKIETEASELRFESNSLELKDLELTVGNNNALALKILETDYSGNLTFKKKDESETTVDEEEDGSDSHKSEENPVQRVKSEAKGKVTAAKESRGNAAQELLTKNPTNIPASVLANGREEIRLGVNGDLFLKSLKKKYKDFKSAEKSKEGKAFLDFLEDKGYEVSTIRFAAGSKKTLEIILKERKELLKYEERRKLEAVEALYSFNRVASILLTEPYLYCNDEESAREELKRIQDIFGQGVLPVFYQTLEKVACGASHADRITETEKMKKVFKDQLETEIKDILKEAGKKIDEEILETELLFLTAGVVLILFPLVTPMVLGTTAAGALTAAGGGIGIAGGVSAGMSMYEIYNSDENIIYNNRRIKSTVRDIGNVLSLEKRLYKPEDYILQARNAISLSSDVEKENKRKELSKKILAQAISKTGEGGADINGAINIITGRFFAATPAFKHFEDLVYKGGASSALNLLLKPEVYD